MSVIRRFDSAEEAADAGAAAMISVIEAARAAGRTCDIALAGGTTPARMYARVADVVGDWSGVRLWLGDERMVPGTSPDANATMIAETLLAHRATGSPDPLERVRTDLPPSDAARDYAARLAAVPHFHGGSPVLDLVVLGIGEDGHTASLFPDRPDLTTPVPDPVVIPIADAPKPPPDRVSLTLATINAARRRIILATGPDKREALTHLVRGAPDSHWPVTLVATEGTEVLTDRDV